MTSTRKDAIGELAILVENFDEELKRFGETLALIDLEVRAGNTRTDNLAKKVENLDLGIRGDDPLGGGSIAVRLLSIENMIRQEVESTKNRLRIVEDQQVALAARVKKYEDERVLQQVEERKARVAVIVGVIAAAASISAAVLALLSRRP